MSGEASNWPGPALASPPAPLKTGRGWVVGPGRLSSTVPRYTVEACGLAPYTFRVRCENARGRRAGGPIAVLGGLRAERGASNGQSA